MTKTQRHRKGSFYLVNGITIYRIVAVPVLLFLVFTGNVDLFKWLLPFSFFSDAIDGYLARKLKAGSVFGARLDSIADDLTVLTAIVALFVLKKDFISEQLAIVIVLLILFAIQNAMAFFRYGKITSFHTYSAKVAAVFQGFFLILVFILPQPLYGLFYITSALTAIDLLEETLLILLLPAWRANVKGLYWVMRKKRKASLHSPGSKS